MFHLLISRFAQPLAAAHTARFQMLRPAPALRGTLLGLLAVLASTGAALAQNGPASSIIAKQADAETLAFTVENPAQDRLHLQVVHQENQKCLMDEANHEATYGCRLRFGKLPAGYYTVKVRVGHERYSYHVQVHAQSPAPATISVRELPAPTAEPAVASAAW